MERKFKVGDRVRILDGSKIPNYRCDWVDSMGKHVGEIHEITHCFNNGGYGLRGVWYTWDERGLEFADKKETIVIYRKGDEVIALDKVSGKTGVAKCGRNDTFDFATGARIAFERLLGDPKTEEQEKTPLNVKIVFTKGDDTFKTGHIYEVKDGNLACPRYKPLPDYPNEDFTKFYSIEELEDYFKPSFERRLHRGGWSGRTLEFIVIKDDPKPEEPKPEEPKYFNGKMVCIENYPCFTTKGKIYVFKNGQSEYDNKGSFPDKPITSVDDLNRRMRSKFIEIKED